MPTDEPWDLPGHDVDDEVVVPCGNCSEPDGDICSCYA